MEQALIFIKNAKRYFKKCVEIKLNCLKKREGEHDVLERVVETGSKQSRHC